MDISLQRKDFKAFSDMLKNPKNRAPLQNVTKLRFITEKPNSYAFLARVFPELETLSIRFIHGDITPYAWKVGNLEALASLKKLKTVQLFRKSWDGDDLKSMFFLVQVPHQTLLL